MTSDSANYIFLNYIENLGNDPLNSQNELVKGLMKYVNGRF